MVNRMMVKEISGVMDEGEYGRKDVEMFVDVDCMWMNGWCMSVIDSSIWYKIMDGKIYEVKI